MKKILLINGVNLNMLGTRQPDIYGKDTLADIEDRCKDHALKNNCEIDCFQSNFEGEIVEKIQKAINYDGLIINAAAFTHTSIAIYDALNLLNIPIIEVHISNIYAREKFRHKSYISPIAKGGIFGFGIKGYILAIDGLLN